MINNSEMENLKPLVIDLPKDGTRYTSVLNPENAVALKSGFVSLGPGEDVGTHNTDLKEELIVFLEGAGEVETDKTGRIPVRAGQVAYNPPHTLHNVINTGSVPLRYIYVVTLTRNG